MSGYQRSGAVDHQGAEASHAGGCLRHRSWAGSISTRPTTSGPNQGHVTLAWGRDYADVTPMKGIALGGGKQLVDVEVRVQPVTA